MRLVLIYHIGSCNPFEVCRNRILYLIFEYVSIFLNAYRFSLKEKKTFVRWFIIGGRTTNEKREKWRQNWPLKRNECSINETAIPYGSNRCSNDINHSNEPNNDQLQWYQRIWPEMQSSFRFPTTGYRNMTFHPIS